MLLLALVKFGLEVTLELAVKLLSVVKPEPAVRQVSAVKLSGEVLGAEEVERSLAKTTM